MVNLTEDDDSMNSDNHNHKKFPNDHLNKLSEQYNKKTKLLISLSVIGLTLFIIGSAALPFKDKILNTLYPKKPSKAVETAVPLAPNIPATRYGFVPDGIDVNKASAQLGTKLYYGYGVYDFLPPNSSNIYMIGKGFYNFSDPSGLKFLMDNNLDNVSFDKDAVGISPSGWYFWSSGGSSGGNAIIEADLRNPENPGTPEGDGKVVKVTHISGANGTQIAQTFKRAVTPGQWVVFGVWAKSATSLDLSDVSVFLQSTASPYPQFLSRTMNVYASDVLTRHSTFDAPGKIYRWTFMMGYAQVPAGVSNFQLVLRVIKPGSVWFDGAVAIPIDSGAADNITIKNLVSQRPGSAWFIDNEEGAESSCYVSVSGTTYASAVGYNVRQVPADFYALIYNQFYKLIKKYDQTAMVMPGGLAGNSVPWDAATGFWGTYCDNTPYNPKQYLNDFRTAYKTKFQLGEAGAEPPVDAIAIHYYENDINEINTANKFKTYMQNLKTYMDGVVGWKDKPIWLTEFGTRKDKINDDNSAVFAQTALNNFLKNNTLNIEKWFWYDTCGVNNVAPLFVATDDRNCTVDPNYAGVYRSTKLGQVWADQDKGPIKVDTSIQVQDKLQVY